MKKKMSEIALVCGMMLALARGDSQPLPISYMQKARLKVYDESAVAIVACVYRVDHENVNKHIRRAVCWATATDVLKGEIDVGKKVKVLKYYDSDSVMELEPGTLVFLLLSELGNDEVVGSGEMPVYSKDLYALFKRSESQDVTNTHFKTNPEPANGKPSPSGKGESPTKVAPHQPPEGPPPAKDLPNDSSNSC